VGFSFDRLGGVDDNRGPLPVATLVLAVVLRFEVVAGAKAGPRKLLIWLAKPQILFILLLSLAKTTYEYLIYLF